MTAKLQALALLLLAFASMGGLLIAADPVQKGTIDFKQGANLKMIFDGGLRPFRLQGLESERCVFDKATLTVILPNCSSFLFAANRASMDVLAGNDLDSLDLFGEYLEVPEAVTLAKTICKAWHLSDAGLDDAAQHLGTMPGDAKGWGAELDQAGLRANFQFKPIYLAHVKAYINIQFRCGTYPHGMKFLTQPIQPPPGYEYVSMDPPPFHPSGPPVPAMSFDEVRAKVQESLAAGTNHAPISPAPVKP